MLTGGLFFCNVVFGQSYGLRFSSHEVVPEKRTSLDLTPTAPICLHDGTDISFDLVFTPNLETYFGYIIRLITDQHQNIDLVYNQRLQNFTFVIGESFSGTVQLDSMQLFRQWNHFRIRFDEKKQAAFFYLNDRLICRGALAFSGRTCCRIYFGTNSFEKFQTLDIPPMSIKDIRITENGQPKYYYPLSESSGLACKDAVGHHQAQAKNPVWLKPRHQHWESARAFSVAGTPSVAFDGKRELLYIVAQDSLYQFSFKNYQLSATAVDASPLPAGNQSVYDTVTGQLYNFYIDEHKVRRYDAANHQWEASFNGEGLTEYWQANKFLSPTDTALYILGGYGQLQYKNLVQRYAFSRGQWETVPAQGDAFMPRYQAALGANATRDTAYIIGGYGSNTGNQAINPKYTYDLLAYSVQSRRFTRMYQLPEPASQFCFANSLVIDPATRDFYALIYPTDKFNSNLQLIRGSLQSPSYQRTGDAIPYAFHDIKSFADLYYCAASKKLAAVTLYNTKDGATDVKIYTLDFPPNVMPDSPVMQEKNAGYWPYAAGALVLLAAGLYFFYSRSRERNRQPLTPPVTTPPVREPHHKHVDVPHPVIPATEPVTQPEENETSTVFLFGQFEVFDKQGQDITKLFTPLLKELFLLILVYSLKDGKGISSERLYEILWSDKPLKDAKNNYSVNIVKLKAILEKIGDCHIGKESGKWKLEILNDSIRIDYQQYITLAAGKPVIDHAYVQALLHIIQRGAFLRNVHYEWLDDVKAGISSQVIDSLLQYIGKADMATEAEFIVKLTNCIFFFDNLNEEALAYKSKCLVLLGRHGMAKDAYLRFAKEYKESYGQEFERSFRELT